MGPLRLVRRAKNITKDKVSSIFYVGGSGPAATFGAGGDVFFNTNNGKLFKKHNTRGWEEQYDFVTATEGATFDVVTISANGTVSEPALKLGTAENGLYQVSSTQLGVSVSNALATLFGTDGIHSDAFKPRVPLGTLETGVTRDDVGDSKSFITTLTIAITDAFSIADNAALAVGVKLFEFPAGAIVVSNIYMSVEISAASAEAQSDTPDVGLGQVVGSTAVATLDLAPAGAETLLTGQTATDANGTATVKTAAAGVIIEAADSHDVFFNAADTWADDTGGDLTCDISGTVTIEWKLMA